MTVAQELSKSTLLIRKILKYLAGLVLLHIIGLLLFSICFSGMIQQSLRHEDGAADRITILFSFVFLLLFCLWDSIEYARDETERHLHMTAMKEPGYGNARYFLLETRRIFYRIPVYLLFQLPMTLFYAAWGYAHENQIFIEKLYVAEAGFYLLTQNALLGWLLSAVVYTVMTASCRLIVIAFRARANRPH